MKNLRPQKLNKFINVGIGITLILTLLAISLTVYYLYIRDVNKGENRQDVVNDQKNGSSIQSKAKNNLNINLPTPSNENKSIKNEAFQ